MFLFSVFLFSAGGVRWGGRSTANVSAKVRAQCGPETPYIITGYLRVWNSDIFSLAPLQFLQSVGESGGHSIDIHENHWLLSMDGLSGLVGPLPGSINIDNNLRLATLFGLEAVTRGTRYIIVLFMGCDANRSGRRNGYALRRIQELEPSAVPPAVAARIADAARDDAPAAPGEQEPKDEL